MPQRSIAFACVSTATTIVPLCDAIHRLVWTLLFGQLSYGVQNDLLNHDCKRIQTIVLNPRMWPCGCMSSRLAFVSLVAKAFLEQDKQALGFDVQLQQRAHIITEQRDKQAGTLGLTAPSTGGSSCCTFLLHEQGESRGPACSRSECMPLDESVL